MYGLSLSLQKNPPQAAKVTCLPSESLPARTIKTQNIREGTETIMDGLTQSVCPPIFTFAPQSLRG